MAVAGGEGDATEGGEGWGDVGGRDGLEVLAGLDAEAHQQNRDVLIVIVGRDVAGAERARLSQWSSVHEPVRFRQDEQVASAAGEITIGHGAARGALRGGAVAQFFGAIDGGHAGLCQRGVQNALERGAILLQLVIDAGHEINVAAGDPRDGGLWVIERFEGFFNPFLHLGQMQDAGVGAGFLHVFGNGHDAVVGAQRDDVISAAYFFVQMR